MNCMGVINIKMCTCTYTNSMFSTHTCTDIDIHIHCRCTAHRPCSDMQWKNKQWKKWNESECNRLNTWLIKFLTVTQRRQRWMTQYVLLGHTVRERERWADAASWLAVRTSCIWVEVTRLRERERFDTAGRHVLLCHMTQSSLALLSLSFHVHLVWSLSLSPLCWCSGSLFPTLYFSLSSLLLSSFFIHTISSFCFLSPTSFSLFHTLSQPLHNSLCKYCPSLASLSFCFSLHPLPLYSFSVTCPGPAPPSGWQFSLLSLSTVALHQMNQMLLPSSLFAGIQTHI